MLDLRLILQRFLPAFVAQQSSNGRHFPSRLALAANVWSYWGKSALTQKSREKNTSRKGHMLFVPNYKAKHVNPCHRKIITWSRRRLWWWQERKGAKRPTKGDLLMKSDFIVDNLHRAWIRTTRTTGLGLTNGPMRVGNFSILLAILRHYKVRSPSFGFYCIIRFEVLFIIRNARVDLLCLGSKLCMHLNKGGIIAENLNIRV